MDPARYLQERALASRQNTLKTHLAQYLLNLREKLTGDVGDLATKARDIGALGLDQPSAAVRGLGQMGAGVVAAGRTALQPTTPPEPGAAPEGALLSRLGDVSNRLSQNYDAAVAPLERAGAAVEGALPGLKESRLAADAVREKPEGALADFLLGMAIPAYQGTPAKLEQFLEEGAKAGKAGRALYTAEKLGSGQGAHTFGYGHYFAENPDVANSYLHEFQADRMGRASRVAADVKNAEKDLEMHQKMLTGETPRAVFQKTGEPVSDEWLKQQIASNTEFITDSKKWLSDTKGGVASTTLHVNHEDLLDWDAPLSEQPASIREAVDSIFAKARKDYESQGRFGDPLNTQVMDSSATVVRRWPGHKDLDGAAAYQLIEQVYGKEGASRALHDAGIPGLRYLDQGSRAAKDGTRNIVMFPGSEDLIEMTHFNGKPVGEVLK